MTAKYLAWTTFGLIMAGAVPFVSDPSVAAAATYNAYTDETGGGMGGVLPSCGACHIQADQEFQKAYAIDKNALCPADNPYRVAVRLSTKIFCTNGVYWVCEDTSSMTCSTYVQRPSCPNDTCQR